MGTSRQTDRQLQRIHGLPGTPVTVSFTGTSATSAALTSGATYMLVATESCHFAFAASPTATTSSAYLPKDVVWPVTIPDNGTTYKVAAIRTDTSGTLFVIPMQGAHA